MLQWVHMYERTAQHYLKKYFNFDEFRSPQQDVIDALLKRQDALVLMPTGGGKSLCYQIPALMLEGLTVVVSPLISLMKDQVASLSARNIPAAYLNSSLDLEQQDAVCSQVLRQEIKLLYVSPERLVTQDMLYLLDRVKVSLIAIDEAHCVSTWGHDFRKEYTQIKELRKKLPFVPFLALTATADVMTRQDIVAQLDLKNPAVFITSFNRPNIHLQTVPGQKRFEYITQFIQSKPGMSGIIYSLSRKSTQYIALKLREQGIPAAYYHAGLQPEEREVVQHAFFTGQVPVLCATIAFGMGIDKPDIRWVIHYNIPKNIEGYYQEIGRAGRDGKPSNALLFYSKADLKLIQPMLEENAQRELQLSKLEEMYAFANTPLCRRQVLLEYFNETMEEPCGNCDVCDTKPLWIDGTISAQKICSAIARIGDEVPSETLIDVLQGTLTDAILKQGYHRFQTFGCGKELSKNQWQGYITQLHQLGIIRRRLSIPHTLRLTTKGKEVLCGEREVRLAEVYTEYDDTLPTVTPSKRPSERLFHTLLQLRKEISEEEKHICIMVSDRMLALMAEHMPITEQDMRAIPGMSDALYDQYGAIFVGRILAFAEETSDTFTGDQRLASNAETYN